MVEYLFPELQLGVTSPNYLLQFPPLLINDRKTTERNEWGGFVLIVYTGASQCTMYMAGDSESPASLLSPQASACFAGRPELVDLVVGGTAHHTIPYHAMGGTAADHPKVFGVDTGRRQLGAARHSLNPQHQAAFTWRPPHSFVVVVVCSVAVNFKHVSRDFEKD